MVKKLDSKAISITPKRSGTATISYKQKGMTKHFTIKVLAYKSPAKTLKVGKHNYAKLFKSTSFANSWGVYGVPGKRAHALTRPHARTGSGEAPGAGLRSWAGDGTVKESRSFIAPCEAVIAGGEGG